MNKRGPVITILGILLTVISLSIVSFLIPSSFSDTADFSIPSLLGDAFDEISNQIQIMPDDSAYVSFSLSSSDILLLWGVQILDYAPGDKISVNISNIFGDDYGEFIQDETISFNILEINQSDTLNFEITNLGTRNIDVIAMFSEDPENSDAFSSSTSPIATMIIPLAISGILLILGIIILIVGVIVILVDLKNNQNDKRNH